MARALERADGGADGRIGIGARRGKGAAGEGGVVTAAVLCVKDKADIKKL